MKKIKYHNALELSLDVAQFGPPHLFSAEGPESFNKKLRNASTNSNKAAPSRDIASAVGKAQRVRFVTGGGTWIDPSSGNRVGMGKKARDLIETESLLRKWELLDEQDEKGESIPFFFRPLFKTKF